MFRKEKPRRKSYATVTILLNLIAISQRPGMTAFTLGSSMTLICCIRSSEYL